MSDNDAPKSELRELYFESARTKFPALFADADTEEQFRLAIDEIQKTMRTYARPILVEDIIENLRNFMLQDIEILQESVKDDEKRARVIETVTSDPVEGLINFLSSSYAQVLLTMYDIAAGSVFTDPATCDCPHHTALNDHRAALEVTEDVSDADLELLSSKFKGSA